MNGYGRGEENQGKEKLSSVISRETIGMTLLLFSAVLFLISIIGSYVLGEIGVAITAFLMGTMGYFIYPFLLLTAGIALRLLIGKPLVRASVVLRALFLCVSVFLVAHLATSSRFFGEGFGSYIDGCWHAAETSALQSTGGGVLFGLIVYPARALLSVPGAYVIFSLLIALSLFLIGWGVYKDATRRSRMKGEKKEEKPEKVKTVRRAEPAPAPAERPVQQPYADTRDYPTQPYADTRDYPPQPYADARDYPTQPYADARGDSPRQPRRSTYSAPYSDGVDRYTPPAVETPRPVDARDVLFGSDPASSYRNNLAFGRDFKEHPRRSSVIPEKPVRKSADPPTYSEAYGTKAEQPHEGMQRKIVYPNEEKPQDGYTMDSGSLNYPKTPSYKATEVPAEEPKDYYSHDVDPVDESPFGRETPAPSRPEEEPWQPRRESELHRAEPEPRPEPLKSDHLTPSSPRDDFGRDSLRDDFARGDREELGRDSLRDDFARGDREELGRDSLRDDFARGDREEHGRDNLRDDFARGDREEPGRDSLRDDFGRGDREELGRDSLRDDFGRGDREELGRDSLRDDFARGDREELGRDSLRDDFARGDREEHGRDSLRDDFARGDREEPGRDSLRDDFGRGDREELGRDSLRDDFARGDREEPGRDSLRDDFGREEPDGESFRAEEYGDTPSPRTEDAGGSRAARGLSRAGAFDSDDPDDLPDIREEQPIERPVTRKKHVYKPYRQPSIAVLHEYDDRITVSAEEIARNSRTIIDTLAGFRLDVEVTRVTVGPSITRYDISIPHNVPVSAVVKRSAEIGMRLHAKDGVNMYANNESEAISIEVPNSVRAIVGIRSVMQAEQYRNSKPGDLAFVIGKDVEGRNVCGNIPKMTHILVAGTTNAGKSVCLNAMLVSLICKYSPEDLRLILIDPKKVEFPVYEGLPHLIINEIIPDAQKAILALNWAIKEMERRYELFEQKTRSGTVVRNIDEYNSNRTEDEEKLPKIVIVVDELADLMSVAKKDIEERIQRLTQKARAAGIHLVLATQRPSVDVITGVIKGNLPTRMACRVIQEVDSRTILDETGAEKLLGNGDMLFKSGGMSNCLRVQGAFISSEEVQAIVEDIKANNEAYFDNDASDYINHPAEADAADDAGAERSAGVPTSEYLRALAMVVKLGQASISLIQRRCSIGYNHAGKIIEWMDAKGYISPFDGKARARNVLLTKEEYESLYGPLDDGNDQ